MKHIHSLSFIHIYYNHSLSLSLLPSPPSLPPSFLSLSHTLDYSHHLYGTDVLFLFHIDVS